MVSASVPRFGYSEGTWIANTAETAAMRVVPSCHGARTIASQGVRTWIQIQLPSSSNLYSSRVLSQREGLEGSSTRLTDGEKTQKRKNGFSAVEPGVHAKKRLKVRLNVP